MRIAVVLCVVMFLSACSYSAVQIPSQTPAVVTTLTTAGVHTEPTATSVVRVAQVIAVDALNIRMEHDYRSGLVGYLMHGESVTIYECWGVWARINADRAHPRWVNARYISGEVCR